MSSSDTPSSSSWLDKLGQLLIREPQDREQLVNLLRDAQERHLINADSLSMLEGALQVSELQVRDIMIPKSQMVYLKSGQSNQDAITLIVDTAHSRFPLIGESLDEVHGILHAKDLLSYIQNIHKISFKDIVRPALIIPETKRLDSLLKEFRIKRNHMAIVVDEFGKTSGLITIEDVLEQIVGDIEDEFDVDDDQYIIKQSKTKYLLKALTPISEFNHFFHAHLDTEDFDTIGGLITQNFGHLPHRGEKISLGKFHFKVLHADKRKIHLLQLNLNSN